MRVYQIDYNRPEGEQVGVLRNVLVIYDRTEPEVDCVLAIRMNGRVDRSLSPLARADAANLLRVARRRANYVTENATIQRLAQKSA